VDWGTGLGYDMKKQNKNDKFASYGFSIFFKECSSSNDTLFHFGSGGRLRINMRRLHISSFG
jgi:hypothetical protein